MVTAIAEKKMTYAEFKNLEIPDGDTSIYELINGEIVRRASPNSPHQILSEKLSRRMGNFAEEHDLGQVLYAPLDVILDDVSAPQPDILFISKARFHVIDPNNGIVGAPDLIVEILSKGTGYLDKGTKKDLYEKFQVKEYWIVDLIRRSIEVYALENGRYKLVSFSEEEDRITSGVLKGFELKLSKLFT